MSKALTWLFQQAAIPFKLFYSFLPSTMVSTYLQTAASPKEELLQIYVRARAITYPIFRCFVCLCEIVSTNCQSSCIPKHSYMHNHAFYVFKHSIKWSRYSYASAFSIPMLISIKISHVNFKFLLPTINVYCHINFKIRQSFQHSCQIQAPAVMSIKFNPFSNTICLCYRSSSQFASKNSLCLSICFCYRSSSQFASENSLYLFFWYPPSDQFRSKNSSCFLFCFCQPSDQFRSKNSSCFLFCILSAK